MKSGRVTNAPDSDALAFGAALSLAALFLIVSPCCAAYHIQKSGSLTLPSGTSLMAFCADPSIQQILSQDLQLAGRAGGANAKSIATLTVSVNQQLLKPGVSLAQIAPGDPQIAELLKAAGATPPPLGDTGSETDKAAVARQIAMQNLRPADSPMQQILNEFQGHGDLGPPIPCNEEASPQPGCLEPTPKPRPGSPGYTGDVQDYVNRNNDGLPFHHNDDSSYDTVVVARASLSGSRDELTIVAVVRPGEDVTDAKKLIAEEIANAVLR